MRGARVRGAEGLGRSAEEGEEASEQAAFERGRGRWRGEAAALERAGGTRACALDTHAALLRVEEEVEPASSEREAAH